MKRNIYILLLSILTVCLISCEKDVEFKGTITKPLLVMNSILTPDSIVSVHLSQSRFTIGDLVPLKQISNASVSVWVNGNLKEQLTYTVDGIYEGVYLPQPGDKIKIEVKADGFDQISSQTVIPKKPSIAVTDSTVTIQKQEYSQPYDPRVVTKTTSRNMKAQLKLADAASEDNYYFIKALQKYYRNGAVILTRPIDLKLSDVLKNNIADNDGIFKDIFGDEWDTDKTDNLFSDLLVNGKDIIFDFSLFDILESDNYYNGEKVDDGRGEVDVTVEQIIEIAEISKDLYQYVISGNKSIGSYDTPFTEPVQVHNNIVNGIGILGSYNTYRFVSQFKTHYLPQWWE